MTDAHPTHPEPRRPSRPAADAEIVRFEAEAYSGPLPTPEMLARYNQIVPGAAARIISMAESQMNHRQHLERVVVEAGVDAQRRGVIWGGIIALAAFGGASGLLIAGQSIAGVVIILGEVFSGAGVFVYGRRRQQGERAEKLKASRQLRLPLEERE